MDWEKLFKRYVWDDEKTPYFVPVARLTRVQANYEVKAYTIFLGILFALVSVASLSEAAPHGKSLGASFYGFTMVCAAVVFAVTKNYYAALYCGAAPLASLAYIYFYGFHAKLVPADHVVILVFVLLWLRYSWRIVSIARSYPNMSPPSGPPA